MKQRLIRNHRGKPLINQFGVPISVSRGWYEPGRYPSEPNDSVWPYWEDGTVDHSELMEEDHWRRIITTARYIFCTAPALRGALLEQASLSFPLHAQYTGEDKAWGEEAEEWLADWRKTANIRGAPYDAEATSRVRLISRKVDGDVATRFEFDATGAPRIRIIESHRIGTRNLDGNRRVKEGPYRGYLCHNGVIHTDAGEPLAYHILGDKKEQDVDVPASELHLCYRPCHATQWRGMSELVASLMHFGDMKLLRSFELRSQQIQSMFAISEKNESGEPEPPGADFLTEPTAGSTTNPSASGLVYRTYGAGMHAYFKSSNPNAGLELLRPDRPGADSQAFGDRILSEAFYGIEWDPHFALAIREQPSGAWARTIIEKIRRCVANNQRMEAAACSWEAVRAISWAVVNGVLPEPSDGDVFSWAWQGPPRVTADTGYEEQANREGYKLGSLSLQDWQLRDGKWWQDVRAQRERELDDLLERAARVAARHGVDLMAAAQLLEQRTPNMVPTQQPQAREAEKPGVGQEES
jgi:capsid protein